MLPTITKTDNQWQILLFFFFSRPSAESGLWQGNWLQ